MLSSQNIHEGGSPGFHGFDSGEVSFADDGKLQIDEPLFFLECRLDSFEQLVIGRDDALRGCKDGRSQHLEKRGGVAGDWDWCRFIVSYPIVQISREILVRDSGTEVDLVPLLFRFARRSDIFNRLRKKAKCTTLFWEEAR